MLKGTALGLVGVTVIATAIFSFRATGSADSISSEKAYAAELAAANSAGEQQDLSAERVVRPGRDQAATDRRHTYRRTRPLSSRSDNDGAERHGHASQRGPRPVHERRVPERYRGAVLGDRNIAERCPGVPESRGRRHLVAHRPVARRPAESSGAAQPARFGRVGAALHYRPSQLSARAGTAGRATTGSDSVAGSRTHRHARSRSAGCGAARHRRPRSRLRSRRNGQRSCSRNRRRRRQLQLLLPPRLRSLNPHCRRPRRPRHRRPPARPGRWRSTRPSLR